ncbi:hypothetical protein AAG596_01405 [Citromicrobium bathyomarinum]|jgi:hypothetical protein|nr:hypothetical protein [Citromicrobium sp. JLT1363]|tara:strand:+ start:56 stop:196 length:141 start_codon:yes stop_codon:yes gene_type:complete
MNDKATNAVEATTRKDWRAPKMKTLPVEATRGGLPPSSGEDGFYAS